MKEEDVVKWEGEMIYDGTAQNCKYELIKTPTSYKLVIKPDKGINLSNFMEEIQYQQNSIRELYGEIKSEDWTFISLYNVQDEKKEKKDNYGIITMIMVIIIYLLLCLGFLFGR